MVQNTRAHTRSTAHTQETGECVSLDGWRKRGQRREE